MRVPATREKISVLIALALVPFIARAQNFENPWNLPDFSATQISETHGLGPELPPWKLYRSGANFRTEQGPGLGTIYAPSSNKVYDTFDNGAVCMEMPMDKAPILRSPLQVLPGTKVEKKLVGSEVVEGHSCTVENVVLTSPDGKTLQAKIWAADDLKGFPVKIEALGSPTFIFRDIVLATPDPALFQPPAKCPRVEDIKAKRLPPVKTTKQ
ncbi:MAG: hypothetical protein JWQ87_130 [Candidatus Sulfotelmatobacter sp.]|nr:hypothetical protein [Candidatus Sulfotelmatobacter sp.]